MASRPERRKYTIPPDEYRSFISGVELEGIHLESSTVKRYREPERGNELKYVERSGKPEYELTSRGFRASLSYSIRMVERGNDEPFGTVSCRFAAEYSSKMPINDAIFRVFRDINLPINLWPYVREHVHSSTAKMALAPLVLPTRKS